MPIVQMNKVTSYMIDYGDSISDRSLRFCWHHNVQIGSGICSSSNG